MPSVQAASSCSEGPRYAAGAVLGLLAFAPLFAAGQQPGADAETQIDEVVVVANKQPRRINDVAANVSVFDAPTMRLELAANLSDVFRYAPGIDFESAGSRFGNESVNIRGISGNRVAMRLDGVPLSDQFDVGSFANATRDLVDAGFVDRVEVLHGPASALYGSAAIGGVVAIATPDPRRPGGRVATTYRASDTSADVNVMQSARLGPVSFLAGYAQREGDEADAAAVDSMLDRRDYRNRSGLFKAALDDALGNTWQASLYHQDSAVQSELASMLGSGRFRSNTALSGDDDYRTDIASLEYRFAAQSLVDDGIVRIYAQETDVRQLTYDERGLASRPVAIERDFRFSQQSRGIEINLRRRVVTGDVVHELGAGLEYLRRETEEFRDGRETVLEDGAVSNVLLGEVFPLRDFPISVTEDQGLYIEDAISAGRWTAIVALRADRYDMRPQPDAMYVEDYPFADPVSITETELSPKLGLIFRPAASMEIYLQYAHGFRAPPYEDANVSLDLPLFNYRAVPNPDLDPERSDGVDAGIRWRGSGASAYLSLFHTDYDDFIESRVRVGTDPDSGRVLFQARNIARASIAGVEAGAGLPLASLLEGLSLDLSLYYARGENDVSGEPLNSVGPPQAVAAIDWQSTDDRWHASLRGTFTDAWTERDESGGELFEPPGSAVFDLFVTRRFGDRVALRAGLGNITDRTWWSWSDVGGLAPDDPVAPYLSRPGRSLSLGLDIQW